MRPHGPETWKEGRLRREDLGSANDIKWKTRRKNVLMCAFMILYARIWGEKEQTDVSDEIIKYLKISREKCTFLPLFPTCGTQWIPSLLQPNTASPLHGRQHELQPLPKQTQTQQVSVAEVLQIPAHPGQLLGADGSSDSVIIGEKTCSETVKCSHLEA